MCHINCTPRLHRRGVRSHPRAITTAPTPDYRCSSIPSPLAPAPDTFEQLQTRVERVSGARDDIVTMLGRMGKGSFDERRSMRKRIYDKKGERVVKAGDHGMLGERTSPLDERATAVQEWDKARFIRYSVKRNSWELQKNKGICMRCTHADAYVCDV